MIKAEVIKIAPKVEPVVEVVLKMSMWQARTLKVLANQFWAGLRESDLSPNFRFLGVTVTPEDMRAFQHDLYHKLDKAGVKL